MAQAIRSASTTTGVAPLQRAFRPGPIGRALRRAPIRPQAVLHGLDVHTVSAAAEHLASGAGGALYGAAHDAAQLLYTLADGDAPKAAADAAAAAADGAGAAAAGGGPFEFLADGFESMLTFLDGLLEQANVPYAYGYSIMLLTLLVKLATYPLSKKSMSSTVAMQALQPRVKELQLRYANEPETLQLETARLYKDAGVNPLAGCLPTLATIPVFIGLYRALTKAADDGLLTSGFYWIPSLGGPTTLAMRESGSGLSWLFPFENGAPPIGWHDAVAYLSLPVLLVASQFFSQRIVSPPSDDPAQQQTQAILKFIPFMIGWFSLNVPSGLTLYWLVNNVISTGQQIYMKKTIKVDLPPAFQSNGGPVIDVSGTPILPKEERAKTASGRELGSRKKKGGATEAPAVDAVALAPQQQQGSRKGAKFAQRKAQEAAAKAAATAAVAGQQQQQQAEAAPRPTATASVDKPSVPDAPPSK